MLLVLHTLLQGFGQVNRPAPGGLLDLLPATESVGNDDRAPGRISYGRQEHSFAHGLRHLVFFLLETKWPRHPAATGIDGLEIRSRFSQQGLLIAEPHQRFVVAVAMQQNFPGKLRWSISRSMMLEELAEKKRLAAQLHGARIPRKQIAEFVAEYGSATGFQDDDGNARFDLRAQDAQYSFEVFFRFVEEAEIVQRPAAA